MNTVLLTGLVIGVVNILLGILVYKFQWDWMISGYNTLNKEEKKNVQIEKIRLLFLFFFVTTGLILIVNVLLSFLVRIKLVHPIGIILIVITFFITNYSIRKYDNNKKGGTISLYRLFHK